MDNLNNRSLEDIHKNAVHEIYNKIKLRLVDSMIYGVPINEMYFQGMVVAAYFLGEIDAKREHAERLQLSQSKEGV